MIIYVCLLEKNLNAGDSMKFKWIPLLVIVILLLFKGEMICSSATEKKLIENV